MNTKSTLLFIAALSSSAAIALAETTGTVTDPSGQKWAISISKAPGGEMINISRLMGEKAEAHFFTTIYPAERQTFINDLNAGIAAIREASARHTPGPASRQITPRSRLTFEISKENEPRLRLGPRETLSLQEALVARDFLSRLDSYVARVKRT